MVMQYSWQKYKGIEDNANDDDSDDDVDNVEAVDNDDNDNDDDDDDDDDDDPQPRQIGNCWGKDDGVEADQGIARHGQVCHLKIWKYV